MLQNLIFKSRSTLILVFAGLLTAGTLTYRGMNREAFPNTPMPLVFVDVSHSSLSPQEGESSVVAPLEKEFKRLEGLKTLSSWASVGHVRLTLEFKQTCDPQKVCTQVHQAVQKAGSRLALNLPKPQVTLMNVATHVPILVMVLTGDVPQQALHTQALWLQKLLDTVPGILRVDLIGHRESIARVILDESHLHHVGLSPTALRTILQEANTPLACDKMCTPPINLYLSGKFDAIETLASTPLRSSKIHHLKLKDVADVRLGLKAPTSQIRHQGRDGVQIEIFAEPGHNTVELVKQVRTQGEEVLAGLPFKLHVIKDSSQPIVSLLKELESGLILAAFLVIGVIFWALGGAPAILVSLSLPSSFLIGMLPLWGESLNIVVLFSLILATGMLVDGTIIVVEHAVFLQKTEKFSVAKAYAAASHRMVWPVISATATVLMAFLPLVMWPGITGKFMIFLPMTVMSVLGASLIVALIFIPAIAPWIVTEEQSSYRTPHADNFFKRLELFYQSQLCLCLQKPKQTAFVITFIFLVIWVVCGWVGRGIEFFPYIDPKEATISLQSPHLMSQNDKQKSLQCLTHKLTHLKGIESLTSRAGGKFSSSDTLGQIYVKFAPLSSSACRRLLNKLHIESSLNGFHVHIHTPKSGPQQRGKVFQVLLQSPLQEQLQSACTHVAHFISQYRGLSGLEDTRDASALMVHVEFDRAAASRHGITLQDMSGALGVLSQQGFKASSFYPPQHADKLDICLFYPRNQLLDPLDPPIIQTRGKIHSSDHIATYNIVRQSATRFHKEGCPAVVLSADIAPGASFDEALAATHAFWATCKARYPTVTLNFQGEYLDRQENSNFLSHAFMWALGGIFLILMIQFNSLFQVLLVLSAVIMSSVGVAIGLLVTGQKFSIVMGGVGMIALAGIVVSNNIILIDTFNHQRRQGQDVVSAIITSCLSRLRPIILTKLTTILGLLPMAMAVTIDFFEPSITLGGPSSQWWVQVATSIVFGVLFASIGTLIFTPCALMAAYTHSRDKKSDSPHPQ